MRHARFGVGLASLSLLTLLGALAVTATVLPFVLGLDRLVLVSGSMSPSMLVGDVVLVDPEVDEPLRRGTVIVFADPTNPGGVVTHRVVRALPDGTYQTQGDANDVPDSTPVTGEMIHGQGRVLVPWVGYPSALLQQGRSADALLLLVAAGGIVYLSRYGWQTRYNPWATPGTQDGRRRTPRIVVAASVAPLLVLGTVSFSPPAARAAFTATTGNAANLLARGGVTYHLHSSANGNVASSATLPMNTTTPTQTTLFNYDTNRNTLAGLTIVKGVGVTETDATKIQKWNVTASSAITLSGTAQLTIWSAMKNFDTTKRGAVQVGIYDCNALATSCTAFGSAPTLDTTPWSTVAGGWTSKTWNLGTVSRTIAVGRVLQVRVATTGASGDDVMFAYDTTTYQSRLTVG